ncbi:hypothetical protein [Vibrio agarivorans]|uniref:hypothetical protein n=1 Tax=Vibrio agarivorans TaxID=153622 RepID=UPI0025B52C7D|nr:hypothetical protein [Vibrio agarivorans]MDN3661062.1 hypothetical protein [Vibrio agarivorans]
MISNMKNDIRSQKKERELKKWIDSLPNKRRFYVSVLGFKFPRPRWWYDSRKIAAMTTIFKAVTFTAMLLSLIVMGFSLTQNVRNKDWQLYTFDQEGVVQWISDLQKIR